MILVFDLDDTLFDELSFVKSGFRAVAALLHEKKNIDPAEAFSWMCQELEDGRNCIFDRVLKRCGLFSKRLVHRCVTVYRKHKPDIELYPEADQCLERFNHYPIYIVTDGNTHVQWNKVLALGLSERITFAFITYRYGIRNRKPSPYCFIKICERENVSPSDVVYVGDNPRKDFVGIRPLGFRTVRVLMGQHRDVQMPPEYHADIEIKDLRHLTPEFLYEVMHVPG